MSLLVVLVKINLVIPCSVTSDSDFNPHRKAKDALIRDHLVMQSNPNGFAGGKSYTLTLAGAKVCHALFNKRFHPSVDPNYVLVQPRHGRTLPDGSFHQHGEVPQAHAHATPNSYTERFPVRNHDDRGFGSSSSSSSSCSSSAHRGVYQDNRNGHRETVEMGVDQTESTAAGDDVVSIRRKRQFALDPSCGETVSAYERDLGLSEEEAWSLYQQTPVKKPNPATDTGSGDDAFKMELAQAMTLSADGTQKATTDSFDSDSQNPELLEAIKLSVTDAARVPTSLSEGDSQNPELLEAIKLSEADADRTVVLDISNSQDMDYMEAIRASNESFVQESGQIWSVPDSPVLVPAQSSSSSSSSSAAPVASTPNTANTVYVEFLDSDSEDDLCWISPVPSRPQEVHEEPQLSAKRKAIYLDMDGDDGSVGFNDFVDLTANMPSDSGSAADVRRTKLARTDTHLSSGGVSSSSNKTGLGTKQAIVPRLRLRDHDILPAPVPVPLHARFSLLVDDRERQRNSHYQQFSKCVSDHMRARAVSVRADVVRLTVGDFMLVLDATGDADADGQTAALRALQRWEAGIAIERKCIDDIVGRSSEPGEGPHFRQERTLRFSGIRHPLFLIEGDIHLAERCSPNTSGCAERCLQRLDVIQGRAELLRFMCGIACRNFGRNRVLILNPCTTVDTAILLAALAVVAANEHDDKQLACGGSSAERRMSLAALQKHWAGRTRNGRQDDLRNFLSTLSSTTVPASSSASSAGVSLDLVHRIERRFGDISSLLKAYYSCSSHVHAHHLLSDLSLCASNCCDEVSGKDDFLGDKEMQEGSFKIYNAMIQRPTDAATPVITRGVKSRQTHVALCREMNTAMDDLSGFSDYVVPVVLMDLGSTRDADIAPFPWCRIITEDRGVPGSRRRSGAIFLVAVSGDTVIEALAAAHDKLRVQRGPHNCNWSSENSSSMKERRAFEMSVAEEAWTGIRSRYRADMAASIAREEQLGMCPQVAVLLDCLGGSNGRTGACGRLKTRFNALSCALHQHVEDRGGEGHPEIGGIKLQNSSSVTISHEAARFLSIDLGWVVNLFVALAVMKHEYLVYHTSGSTPINEVVATFICEMQRQALLTYEHHDEDNC